MTQVFDTLITNGYSRSQEYDADEFAAALMKRVGYPQSALVTMLKALEASSDKEAGLFATHPAPEKRIDELEDEIVIDGGTGAASRNARFARFIKKL